MKKSLVVFFLFIITVTAQERRIEWYGYAQVDFVTSNKKGFVSTFDQRRMNLIGEFFLDNRVRALADVEYEGGANYSAESSSKGTIKISRAWIEYTYKPYLKIRAGKMLTPFGLYNLIHDASASYIAADPPLMYSSLQPFPALADSLAPQRFYSKYSIGLELNGTFDLDNDGSQLEYYLGVANGRGETLEGTDISNNKAVYGRLIYRPSFLFGFQMGTSFYYDKNLSGIGGIQNDKEFTFAMDLQYESSNWQIQAEGLLTSFKNPNRIQQNASIIYLQTAYTFFDCLTPFINVNSIFYDIKEGEPSFNRVNLGLNWGVTTRLFLKSEIQFHSAEEEIISQEKFILLKLSAALAF